MFVRRDLWLSHEANLRRRVGFRNNLRNGVSFITNYRGGSFFTWVSPLTLAGSLNRQYQWRDRGWLGERGRGAAIAAGGMGGDRRERGCPTLGAGGIGERGCCRRWYRQWRLRDRGERDAATGYCEIGFMYHGSRVSFVSVLKSLSTTPRFTLKAFMVCTLQYV